MRNIAERDWKKLRDMKDDLLQVACGRILDKAAKLVAQRKDTDHKTYRALWKMLREEDREIALMFNDVKRSTAFFKLATWYSRGLIDNDVLQQFSAETRESVLLFSQGWSE